jgi:hypothetical protein
LYSTQVFVEQCRELDIAIAVSTKNAMTTNIAALMRKQQMAGTPGGVQQSGPSQRSLATVSMGNHIMPAGNAAGKPAMGDKFDKLGKELNKTLTSMIQVGMKCTCILRAVHVAAARWSGSPGWDNASLGADVSAWGTAWAVQCGLQFL